MTDTIGNSEVLAVKVKYTSSQLFINDLINEVTIN